MKGLNLRSRGGKVWGTGFLGTAGLLDAFVALEARHGVNPRMCEHVRPGGAEQTRIPAVAFPQRILHCLAKLDFLSAGGKRQAVVDRHCGCAPEKRRHTRARRIK